MAVSRVNSGYYQALYTWDSQQLKSTGNSSSSKASSSASSLFSGSSMVNQISSMVELTKYAMDQMGVTGNSRVTFSQIEKYRQQLQSEFNNAVKAGLGNSGLSNISSLSFSLDKNGTISVIGENAQDRKKAQAWFDANSSYGKELLKNLESAGIEIGNIDFTISRTGKINLIDKNTQKMQEALDAMPELTENLRKGLSEAGINALPLDLKMGGDGQLEVNGESEYAEQVNAWLAANPELAKSITEKLEKNNIDLTAASLRLVKEGNLQININNANNNEIQAVLDKAGETGKKIYAGLEDLGIDPNINFSLQFDDDGKLVVISDHPDAAKVQQFFNENPELVKKYQQIETLAGIDDARKAMQISPSEMRKRIQIESMASWWADSGDSNSYFGQYSSSNGLSLLSGLNLQV